MSQFLESLTGRGTLATTPEVQQPVPQQGLDLVKILWRWKWLPVLGLLIGAGTGYMFYTKLPQQYESVALVQVVSNVPMPVKMDLYDAEKVGYFDNRNDESRAIRSLKVIGLAVKDGALARYFPDSTEEDVIKALMDIDDGVMVQPAEKNEKTTTQQLLISYKCQDPEKARAVVDAVVAGYQAFLSEEYKSVDDELLKTFATTEKRLSKTYQDLFDQQQKFRQDAPNVLWNSDDPIDPYADSYMRLKAQLEEIKVRRTKLRGTLQQVTEAQKAKRRAEDILVMLHDGTDNSVQSFLVKELYAQPKEPALESEILERQALVPLRATEQKLLETYGAAHPTIQSLRREIHILEERIAVTRQTEAKAKTENDQLYSKSLRAEENNGLTDLPPSLPLPDSTGTPEENMASVLTRADWIAKHWLEVRLNALKESYLAMERHEKDLQKMADEELRKSQELQHYLQKNAWMKEQLVSVKEMLALFSDKVKAVELVPTNVNQRVLRELSPATFGQEAGPYAIRYICGGAAIGLLLMSGLAVLMDLSDRSYRSPDEIVADLGKPILGHIPAIELNNLKRVVDSVDSSIVTLHHSRGRIAEAFRSVRTCLFFSGRTNELKVIQVSSPVPGDGKSTLSANLAVTMAQSGRRVLLLDADFRRPRQQKLFGIDTKVGMAQVLAGKVDPSDATFTTCIANLSIMPGGQHPNNPAELLSSNRFTELMEMLREKYDIIVIDTPPVLAVSDPCAVAAIADGVVVTMRLRRNVKPLASRTFNMLESVNANVLGVVVNGVSTEAAYGGYGYNYSYNDYRDSYRYDGKSYGYGRYGELSAGYIEDKQVLDESFETDVTNDGRA